MITGVWYWLIKYPEAAAAIAAIAAVVLSLCGLFLTLHQLRAERRYRKILLEPCFEFKTDYLQPQKSHYYDIIRISVVNNGLGPGRFQSFELHMGERKYASFLEWLNNVPLIPSNHAYFDTLKEKRMRLFKTTEFWKGKILPPNQELLLLSYSSSDVDTTHLSESEVEQVLLGFFRHVKMTTIDVVYTDMFGKRKEAHAGPAHWIFPEPVLEHGWHETSSDIRIATIGENGI